MAPHAAGVVPPELEILLRVLFADAGDPAELLGALAATRERMRASYADGRAMLADPRGGRPGESAQPQPGMVAGEPVLPARRPV